MIRGHNKLCSEKSYIMSGRIENNFLRRSTNRQARSVETPQSSYIFLIYQYHHTFGERKENVRQHQEKTRVNGLRGLGEVGGAFRREK